MTTSSPIRKMTPIVPPMNLSTLFLRRFHRSSNNGGRGAHVAVGRHPSPTACRTEGTICTLR